MGGRSGYEFFETDSNYLYTICQWFPRMAMYNDVYGWQNKQFLGRGEFTLDFGDYDVRITVPADHIVASTGELQNMMEVLTKEQIDRYKKSRSASNPMIIISQDEAIINEKSRSKKTDNVVVYPRENFSFNKIIKALKSPVIFYYIADEDLGTQNSEFADFFNEKKSTLVSIRKVAKLSNACVIPCINLYCSVSNKYFTYVDEPLEFSSIDDPKKDALIINQALEKLISRDLSQYMWSLRLFQTRPNGQSYPYSK